MYYTFKVASVVYVYKITNCVSKSVDIATSDSFIYQLDATNQLYCRVLVRWSLLSCLYLGSSKQYVKLSTTDDYFNSY